MSYLQGRTRFWDEALFLGFLSNKRHILLSFFLCPDVWLVWNLRTLFIWGSFNAQTGIKLHCYEIRPLILAASKLWQIWTLNEMNCVIWVKIKSERKGMLSCGGKVGLRWHWGVWLSPCLVLCLSIPVSPRQVSRDIVPQNTGTEIKMKEGLTVWF